MSVFSIMQTKCHDPSCHKKRRMKEKKNSRVKAGVHVQVFVQLLIIILLTSYLSFSLLALKVFSFVVLWNFYVYTHVFLCTYMSFSCFYFGSFVSVCIFFCFISPFLFSVLFYFILLLAQIEILD